MEEAYSGRFVLRIPPPLHRRLARQAEKKGVSLNRHCLELLNHPPTSSEATRLFQPLLKQLHRLFPGNLMALILFGSQITQEATAGSDTDLLIVLEDSAPLDRSLYRLWDEQAGDRDPTLSPQFVHLPPSPREAGGLWFEVAMAHQLMWEKSQNVSRFLDELKNLIAAGLIRRYWSHGQPYWIWRDDAEQVTRP